MPFVARPLIALVQVYTFLSPRLSNNSMAFAIAPHL
jgi:hypothetical protein